MRSTVIALCVAMLPGCNSRAAEQDASSVEMMAEEASAEGAGGGRMMAMESQPQPQQPSQQDIATPRAVVIRTGSARIEVESVDRAVGAVTALAARLGATVAASVRMTRR